LRFIRSAALRYDSQVPSNLPIRSAPFGDDHEHAERGCGNRGSEAGRLRENLEDLDERDQSAGCDDHEAQVLRGLLVSGTPVGVPAFLILEVAREVVVRASLTRASAALSP
jgi:hypothetical protein